MRKMLIWIVLLAFACPATAAPNVAVWVEVNTLRETVVNDAIAGIEEWGTHPTVTTVIVSTAPGRETLYSTLLPVCERAGLTLIPGIKTAGALPRVSVEGETRSYRQLDDVAGWSLIAGSVARAALYAESPIVLLENESAVIGHTKGLIEIDDATMSRALRQLPHGLTLVWYPTVTSGYEDRQARQLVIVRMILAEHPNVLFTDNSIDRPRAFLGAYATKNHATLRALSDRSFYRLLYCYGPGSNFWMDDAIVPLIVGAVQAGDWAVLYPGAARFGEAAEKIGPLLKIAFGTSSGAESETISGE